MPLLPLIGILFLTLKLMHIIFWSWVWVLLPFWIIPVIIVSVPITMAFVAFVLPLIGAAIFGLVWLVLKPIEIAMRPIQRRRRAKQHAAWQAKRVQNRLRELW